MSCGLLAGGIPVPHTDTSCVVGNTNKNKIQCSPTQVPFNSDRREKVKKTDYAQQWPFWGVILSQGNFWAILGIFCHFPTQIPLKYLKITPLELTNQPGTKKFWPLSNLSNLCPSSRPMCIPLAGYRLKCHYWEVRLHLDWGAQFIQPDMGRQKLFIWLPFFLEKQIIYCEADAMRPYQPPSHVSRNKQYDARWKHNTTLGWIEIKKTIIGKSDCIWTESRTECAKI